MPTIAPSDATNTAVTWSSGNEAVATVDENGVVTGVAEGTATITVTTSDGSYTATCTVTVTAASTKTSWKFDGSTDLASITSFTANEEYTFDTIITIQADSKETDYFKITGKTPNDGKRKFEVDLSNLSGTYKITVVYANKPSNTVFIATENTDTVGDTACVSYKNTDSSDYVKSTLSYSSCSGGKKYYFCSTGSNCYVYSITVELVTA